MNEEKGTKGFSDGLRQGLGVLTAFKEAIEETFNEARDRGDLTPERAKELARSAMERAQLAAGDARERFDFVPRREFDRLQARVNDLEARLHPQPGDEPIGSDAGGDTIP